MAERVLTDEARYTVLRHLANDPGLSQRDLARDLGISLGKVNYCLKALLDKGYIKADNFKNSKHKRAYLYQLTPAGIAAKSRATTQFLARKRAEYDRLERETEELRREAREEGRMFERPGTTGQADNRHHDRLLAWTSARSPLPPRSRPRSLLQRLFAGACVQATKGATPVTGSCSAVVDILQPGTRTTPVMKERDNDKFGLVWLVNDRVWKLAGDHVSELALYARKGKWHSERASYCCVCRAGKLKPQTG